MRTKKRLLSILLALVMCLGLLPVPAASASASGDLSQNYEVFSEEEEVKVTMGGTTLRDYIVRYGLKDRSGNVVIPAKYAGMYLYKGLIIAAGKGTCYKIVAPDGVQEPQYGIIDINQNVLVPFEYDTIYPLGISGYYPSSGNYVYENSDNASGYLVTKKGGLSGIMTDSLQTVIQPKYFALGYLGNGYFNVSDTHNKDADGFINHYNDNKFGVCDSTGNLIIPIQYDGVNYLGDGYFSVTNDYYVGVVNSKNDTILPMEYAYVKDTYKDTFIVAIYTDTDEEARKEARHTLDVYPYWGRLLVTYGIVDTKNQPLIDMTKYAKITVMHDNGLFICYRWEGDLKPGNSIGGAGSTYQYVYEYDYINYPTLGVPVTTTPSTISTPSAPVPAPSTESYLIPDSKGMAEFSTPPLRTYTDTIADIDAYQDGMDDIPEKEITIYEVADGTKLMLTDAAKQKGYDVSRLNGGESSKDELVLHPAGPVYEWYLMMADGETYEEVEANSITLYIRPINQNAVSFQDVKANDYYHDAVQWAVKYGVTTGTSATKFSPGDTCTVGQILTFLWRADGADEAWEYGDKKFGNIARNDYFYFSSLWALNEYEMVSGADFAANTPCTRSMVATYLWKMQYCPEPTTTTLFTDVPASAEYAQAVNWMVENGITTGTSTTTFSPNDTCTRGQIATFIYRYYKNLGLD